MLFESSLSPFPFPPPPFLSLKKYFAKYTQTCFCWFFFLCETDPGHTTTIYSETLLAEQISILKTETKPLSRSSQLGREEHEPLAKATTESSAIQ